MFGANGIELCRLMEEELAGMQREVDTGMARPKQPINAMLPEEAVSTLHVPPCLLVMVSEKCQTRPTACSDVTTVDFNPAKPHHSCFSLGVPEEDSTTCRLLLLKNPVFYLEP